MACKDFMIWVGKSYETVHSFVKEAGHRGCCRKVPTWPPWAIPGKSRVFLAHRDDNVRTDKGSIFGFFIMHGVDIILGKQDIETLKDLRNKYKQSNADKDTERLVDFFEGKISLQRLPVCISEAPSNYGKRNEGSKHPDRPDNCSKREDNWILDFILDLLIPCEGQPFPPDGGCSIISREQALLEEGRKCGPENNGVRTPNISTSKNTDIAPIYITDGLTQLIDFLFCELLKELIKEKERKRPKKRRIQIMAELEKDAKRLVEPKRQKGIREFQQVRKMAIEEIENRPGSLPKRLLNITERHGMLWTFIKPYPVFRKLPQAAFKGLIRIDGDELFNEIITNYHERKKSHKKHGRINREIELPICYGMENDTQTTSMKSQLVRIMARKLRMDTTMVSDIMDSYAKLITEELKSHQKIRLQNIGTFLVKVAKGNKQVKFKVSQVLKKAIRGN